MKTSLLLISAVSLVAAADAQVPTAPAGKPVAPSFLGKWTRTRMTVEGKETQNFRITSDLKIHFVSTDENGNKVNQYGSWKANGNTLTLLISPKRGGTRFDESTFKRTSATTMKATKFNPKIWGSGPIVFTFAGKIEGI
jgi:hypothetical protein